MKRDKWEKTYLSRLFKNKPTRWWCSKGYFLFFWLFLRLGVSVVTFRNLHTLKHTIRPFFVEYPLIGSKSFEFERWCELVDIFSAKDHLGKTLEQRDVFLKFLAITKELNARRVNKRKLMKIDIMSEWLSNLKTIPTKEEKLALKVKIKTSLVGLESE